jgi:hypothetical protein
MRKRWNEEEENLFHLKRYISMNKLSPFGKFETATISLGIFQA